MKKLLILLMFPLSCIAQDTIFEHVGRSFVLNGIVPECYSPTCFVDGCKHVTIADTGSITMNFGAIGAIYSISVIQDGLFILQSECTWIDSGVPSYSIDAYFPVRSELLLCGSFGDSLFVFYKHVPQQNYPAFGVPIDTLCPMTSITEPIEPEKWSYFYAATLEQVADLQPNTAYLKRKKL